MQTYDLSLIQGTLLSIRTFAQNSDGTYINLSGYSVKGQIRQNFSSTGILLDLMPVINTTYISGIVDINITGSLTTGLPCGQFPYDVQVSSSDLSTTIRILRGYANIEPAVTR